MDILIFGQQNWDVCWTAKQHLATGLAGRGHRVIYVDPDPAPPGFERIQRNLWLSRDRPWPLIGWRANQARAWAVLRRHMRQVRFTAPVAMALHPSVIGRLRRLRRFGLLYYAVDDYAHHGGLTEAARTMLHRQEAELLERADVVLGVSPTLVEKFGTQRGEIHLLENGADVEHFAPQRLVRMRPHPAMAELRGPVLGFFGQVDGRLDQDLVLALARRRPQWNIVLAGRVKGISIEALAAAPNVHLLGYQDYRDLPAIARDTDVWLLPYRQTKLTHACDPLKVYEYLATGKPVVATPLDGLVRCREAVTLAQGTDAWTAAIEAALAQPGQGASARLALAHANAWPARVESLEQHLQEARERAFHDSAAARSVAAATARRASPLPDGTNEYGLPAPRLALGGHLPLLLAAQSIAIMRRALRAGRSLPARPRILWTRRANLGDVLVMLPALRALRTTFPQAHIAVGIGPHDRGRELLEMVPEVDEVIPGFIWSGQGRNHELRALRRLWARRFDVVMQSGIALFEPEGAFAGAPRVVSLYDGHPLATVAGRALLKEFHLHEGRNASRLAETVTGLPLDPSAFPQLQLGDQPVAGPVMQQVLADAEGHGILVVHPGSSKPTRRWPEAHFAACLAQVLSARPRLRAVITGTPPEATLARRIRAALPADLSPRVIDGTGQTSLADLAALLRRADALLCNDTGILHLGRACGTPLVAVLGPENPRLWGPYPTGAAPAVALRVEVPCAPCALNNCPAHWCMRALPPQDVAERLLRILDGNRGAGLPTEAVLDNRPMGWQVLAHAGEALPLCSLVLVPEHERAPIDAFIAAAERQTYPRIELIFARTAAMPPFIDDRDARRRGALPIRQVVAEGSRDPLLAAGVAAAGGALIANAAHCLAWPPTRLADDMAAAIRAPEAPAFRDGAPVIGGVSTRPWTDDLGFRPGALSHGILPTGAVREQAAE